MKIKSLRKVLTQFIKAGKPILLTGAPGVGKTDIVEQAARDAGAKLLTSHPVVSDPTDFKGLPFPDLELDMARFLPFGELKMALEAKTPLVWFFDDLGQAPAMVQAAIMQLLLGRKIGVHKLPDCVTFVAATNRAQDRAGVSSILEPVKSRFNTIVDVEPDLDSWTAWAHSAKMPPELTAFLRFRPGLLLDFKPTAALTNSSSPRTWAKLGENLRDVVTEEFKDEEILEICRGTVDPSHAEEFLAFRKLALEAPSLENIILNPDKAPIPTQISMRYAVCEGLARMCTTANFNRLCIYAKRLLENNGEFAVVLVKACETYCPAVKETSAYTDLMTNTELFEILQG